MKKYLLILAGAAALAGCGQQSEVAVPPPPPSENVVTPESTPVVVTDQTLGSFHVDGRSETGTQFRNVSGRDGVFAFAASGQWAFATEAGMLNPSGASTVAGSTYLLPGARSFSLIAGRDDGTYIYVGDHAEIPLKAGASLYFTMNDLRHGFVDNRGFLTVVWSKKP